jgi:ADP-ribosylglycohydrolase
LIRNIAVSASRSRSSADRRPAVGQARVEEEAYELGNGSRVTAQDTVPFALWTAAAYLDDYPAAITACVKAGGDVDTTAAIVGGIVAAYTGIGDRTGATGLPQAWLDAREPLPTWATRSHDRPEQMEP